MLREGYFPKVFFFKEKKKKHKQKYMGGGKTFWLLILFLFLPHSQLLCKFVIHCFQRFFKLVLLVFRSRQTCFSKLFSIPNEFNFSFCSYKESRDAPWRAVRECTASHGHIQCVPHNALITRRMNPYGAVLTRRLSSVTTKTLIKKLRGKCRIINNAVSSKRSCFNEHLFLPHPQAAKMEESSNFLPGCGPGEGHWKDLLWWFHPCQNPWRCGPWGSVNWGGISYTEECMRWEWAGNPGPQAEAWGATEPGLEKMGDFAWVRGKKLLAIACVLGGCVLKPCLKWANSGRNEKRQWSGRSKTIKIKAIRSTLG